jgi:hypothetical protein
MKPTIVKNDVDVKPNANIATWPCLIIYLTYFLAFNKDIK